MPERTPDLTLEQKALLFDRFAAARYETLLELDAASGSAAVLFSSDPSWSVLQGTRFPYEEMLGRYLRADSMDTDPPGILTACSLEIVTAILAEQGVHRVSFMVRGSDGSLRVKQAVFLPGAGTNSLLLGIADISDSFQEVSAKVDALSETHRQAQEEVSRKNTFLSLLNQHIRTPLYSIIGLAKIAENAPSGSAFNDYLHRISMSGSYMQETIEDVLNLRQIAERQIRLRPETVDLESLLRSAERAVLPLTREKGLLFEDRTDSISGLCVLADSWCLGQIVNKLLRSSISYAVRGSRIGLEARRLFGSGPDVALELSVTSRGFVIDRERLNLLLRPYDFLRDRLDENTGALDLSLIVLRSCVMAMGSGTITAESDERDGTRISVTLSLPEAAGSGPKPVPADSFDFRGKRILLVDDNEISLEISEHLLKDRGILVTAVRSGAEAISCFAKKAGAFDLILMDVLMPEMNGLEATRKIRSLAVPGAETVPIIALTVNALRRDFEESLQAGMNAHLVKPIEPEQLYETLAEFLPA